MVGRLLSMPEKLCVVAACMCVVLVGCQSPQVAPEPESIDVSPDISLHPIAEGVWVYTAYFDLPDVGRYPANGLLVIDGSDALLVDLPWTDEQTGALCDWIEKNHGATVRTVVPTHFHQDCMGGLAEAHRRGAMSYGLDKTVEIARQKGLPVPKIPFQARIMVRCGRTVVMLTYHGAGHTTDNVVAWLPKQSVLFGGCLIKSLDAQSLGNTKDGDLQTYPTTLNRVLTGYPQAKIVVPGHGAWGGTDLIEHTLELCPAGSPQP